MPAKSMHHHRTMEFGCPCRLGRWVPLVGGVACALLLTGMPLASASAAAQLDKPPTNVPYYVEDEQSAIQQQQLENMRTAPEQPSFMKRFWMSLSGQKFDNPPPGGPSDVELMNVGPRTTVAQSMPILRLPLTFTTSDGRTVKAGIYNVDIKNVNHTERVLTLMQQGKPYFAVEVHERKIIVEPVDNIIPKPPTVKVYADRHNDLEYMVFHLFQNDRHFESTSIPTTNARPSKIIIDHGLDAPGSVETPSDDRENSL